jgi:hypothetical protein
VIHRRAAGICVLLGAVALAASVRPAHGGPVVPPGQEALLADLLGRGVELPGPCRFSGGGIAAATIKGVYTCPGGEVVIELHPAGGRGAAQTDRFTLVVASGAPPAGLVDALRARIVAGEAAFEWADSGIDSAAAARLRTLVVFLCGLIAVALVAWVRWQARRRGSSPAAELRRVTRLAVVVGLLAMATAAVVELGYRGLRWLGAPRPSAEAPFELYGLGESTMVGMPFAPKLSLPVLLDYMFDGRIDGRRIDVRNLAESGVPLYPQAAAFERALAARNPAAPGAVVIFSGHNEGWLAAASDADEPYRPHPIAEHSAVVGDLLLALRRNAYLGREHSLRAWEYYLRRVIESARAQGLLPILATMASNIARIEPNADAADRESLAAVERGLGLERQGALAAACEVYRAAIGPDPTRNALLSYRAGRCEERLGNLAAAREHYWDAVDRDSRLAFGRATRAQNALLRRLAHEYDLPLVDAVEIFAARSPGGLIGDGLIIDGQHPTLAGYRLLAGAIGEILSQRFATPLRHPLSEDAEVTAALEFGPSDLTQALMQAGSWLIATSVGHPAPDDRMALAEQCFAGAVGRGDDFSAWFGVAMAQAAARGGMLREADDVALLGNWAGYHGTYSDIGADELARLLPRFAAHGVDPAVLTQLRALHPRS